MPKLTGRRAPQSSYRAADLAASTTTAELLEPRRMLAFSAPAEWTAYVGGGHEDSGSAVTMDRQGNVYVAGTTTSAGFGGHPEYRYPEDHPDVYVAKLDSAGTRLWAVTIGQGQARAIAVDDEGSIWVAGFGGFVTRLSADGEVLWTTYLGERRENSALAILLDLQGNVLVGGRARFHDIGGTNGDSGDGSDGFLAKLSSAGSVMWVRYVGGSQNESVGGMAVDGQGNVLLAGWTGSNDLEGANNSYHGGDADAFVAKTDASGNLLWSTYFGGSGSDGASGVAIDASGDVLVVGRTESPGFGGGNAQQGGPDAWVARLSDTGELRWASSVGGSGMDVGVGVVADRLGNALITGWTTSTDLSMARNISRGNSGFVASVSPVGTLEWLRYFGSGFPNGVSGMVSDGRGSIVVAGSTQNPYLPLATNRFAGFVDGYVVKLSVEETIAGTAGDDYIRVSAATVMDAASGQSLPGLQVTVNGVAGGSFVPMGEAIIYGEEGNDTIMIDPEVSIPVWIYGGDGNDTITGGGGNDTLYGNFGDDLLQGGEGSNSLLAGLGNDTLYGGERADTLLGGNGVDLINGQGGDDYIEGRGKADTIRGGAGNDTIWGGAGDNVISGGEGDDWIDAGPAGWGFVNRIDGVAGSDTVVSDGDDLLEGVEVVLG